MSKYPIHIPAGILIFLLITISYTVMAFRFPLAYIVGTYEDFFGEWAQFFFFVIVFLLSISLKDKLEGLPSKRNNSLK